MMGDGMAGELELVEQYLRQFTEDVAGREPLSGSLGDVLGAPGKRLRPRLVLACGLLGERFEEKRDRLCRIGALIEMIHSSSLIHDDIIDDSPLRRGKRTIQSKYGKDMAVYTGDYILGKVLYHLMDMGAVHSGMILGSCVQDMCAGDLSQHFHRFDSQVSREEYLAAVYGKTASLFRAACTVGALEGGCGRAEQARAGELGEAIGMYFQLRDDVMDFQARDQWDGKPACQDFCRGIYTLPVICALDHPAVGTKMRRFIEESGQGETGEEVLRQRLDHLITEADGICHAKRCMERYKKKAFDLVSQMPEGRGKEELYQGMEICMSDVGGLNG